MSKSILPGDVHIGQHDDKLKQLLTYCERGWRIFPLWEKDENGVCKCKEREACDQKHPRIKWQNPDPGRSGATSNRGQVQAWHQGWPEADWAVALDDLFVVDVDKKHDGMKTLDEVEENWPGLLDITLVQETPSGGRQFFYRQPLERNIFTVPQGRLKRLKGFEIKGLRRDGQPGSYVGIPPSRGRDWLDVREPAEATPDLLKEVRAARADSSNGDAWSGDGEAFNWSRALAPGAVPDGEQDAFLFAAASSLRAQGVGDATAVPMLHAVVRNFTNYDTRRWEEADADEKWEHVKRTYLAGRSQTELGQGEQMWLNNQVWTKRFDEDVIIVTGSAENIGEIKDAVDKTDAGPVLRFYSLKDVARTYRQPIFLVRNSLLVDAFKFTGGAEKTLKSWTMLCEAISVAAGVPLFGNDEFAVPRARRVLVITGEGGVDLYLDRARHICRGLGIAVDDVADNILVTEQVLPFDHPGFGRGLQSALDAHDPALIHIEPLYVYMGATAAQNAGNVYAMGPVLARLREMCAGRAVHIGHHFTKAGRESLTLSSLTQAGAREFADHWCLLAHREPPNLDAQSFKLTVSVGARRGFGWVRNLDIALGPLDLDTLLHEGRPTFTLADVQAGGGEVDWRQVVYQEIRDEPGEWTQKELTSERNDVALDSPGKRLAALKKLVDAKVVRTEKRTNSHGGRRADRFLPVLDVDLEAPPNLRP